MITNRFFCILVCVATVPLLHGTISTVYNMRIAETTKLNANTAHGATNAMAIATVFNQWRIRYSGSEHAIGGGMASLVYIPSDFYARVDCAVANLYDVPTQFYNTEPDDILFSTGYSIPLNNRTKMTFSGLLGLPTHQDSSLDHIQFGYGHVGVGSQIDAAWIYSADEKNMVRTAARCIYFVPQIVTALNDNGCYQNFRFGNGFLTDLFIAHTSTIEKHKLEVGYNPQFLYGATLFPHITDALAKSVYTRSFFYGTYSYAFSLKTIPSYVTAALSYGFDSNPRLFRNKRILTVWASWGIDF